MKDPELHKFLTREERRARDVINLIASENYVSTGVREVLGSILTNKYAEGYPGLRYYGGNEFIDEIEELAQRRARELFKLKSSEWHVNVQPYSGSPANLAIYLALVPIGGKIMGLELAHGGHLTHGHKVSASGKLWKQVPYQVARENETLDYVEIERIAMKERPHMLVAGFTAYSRVIDFKRLSGIAKKAGALFLVDMSHIAGLVAGGVYLSPFPYADVVMTTTHKTLRGPRAAVIFSRPEHASAIDKAVFPGLQGGPHVNQIAAVAVALSEATRPQFRAYAEQIIKNTKKLAGELAARGWRIVSGGTDTHLFLVDTWREGLGGKEAEERLEAAGIVVNKNTIPYDTRTPSNPSGIRIGTAAVTTRGMKERDMVRLAGWIDAALKGGDKAKIFKEVRALTKQLPLP